MKKKVGFCACLLAMGGIGTMGTNACSSSSSTSGSSSGSNAEAGSDTGGGSGGDASGSSSGNGSSSGSSSGSSGGSSSGSGDGGGGVPSCDMPLDATFSCPANDAGKSPPVPNTSMGCDQCIEGCCATEWCTCSGDSNIDDAGVPGCLDIIACTLACIAAGDAGSPTTCFQNCAAANGNATSGSEALTLFQCVATSCGTGICLR